MLRLTLIIYLLVHVTHWIYWLSFYLRIVSKWEIFNFQYHEPRSYLFKSAHILRYLWWSVCLLCVPEMLLIIIFCWIWNVAINKYIIYSALKALSTLHHIKPFLSRFLFSKDQKDLILKKKSRFCYIFFSFLLKTTIESLHKNTLLPLIKCVEI